MIIEINNEQHTTTATTVAELATELQLPERGVALAINNAIVPRTQWADTSLVENCRITVIKAAFGG